LVAEVAYKTGSFDEYKDLNLDEFEAIAKQLDSLTKAKKVEEVAESLN